MKNIYFIGLFFIGLFAGCSTESFKLADSPLVKGLNSPVVLQPGTTSMVTEDYVTDPSEIDTLLYDSSAFFADLSFDKKNITIVPKSGMPPISDLKMLVGGEPFSIPVKRSDKIPVVFSYPAMNKDVKVQIKGDMNAWNPAASSFTRYGDVFTDTFMLSPGQYQYLMVIDGKEMTDPTNPLTIDNNTGGANSLLVLADNSEKVPDLETGTILKNGFTVQVKNPFTGIYVYLDNTLLPHNYIETNGNIIKIHIPGEAGLKKRTNIRAWAYNDYGVSNDLFVPLEYGNAVTSVSELDRFDKRARIMYFLMVDRFYDGDSTNDHPLNRSDVLPEVDFKGGDLTGVTDKITSSYFTNLGVNTIWLSPITQNPLTPYGLWLHPMTKFSGYHGYWPVSSTKTDFRFGTSTELKSLVELAHDRNINIILDYVANHVHEKHPLYKQHHDWATSLYLPDGTLNTQKWDEYRLTTWFDTFLPSLDFSKPEVVDAMTDSALFWIRKYDLDGFRHDATKHIPESFWRMLTLKMKKELTDSMDRIPYQVGETYGSRELISSYIGSGMLDGQFDFNVYDDAVAVFARPETSFKRLSLSLKESRRYYGVHNLMGYISGNQDRPRFISYAGGALSFDEDTKEAGWERDVEIGDTVAYKKLLQLLTFNLSIPGVPCIYYGDEIGMPGANDPDNRRMMKFDNLSTSQKNLLSDVKKVIHARRDHLALIYGDFNDRITEDSLWVFSRKYFDQEAIIILGKNKKRTEVQVPLTSDELKKTISPVLGTRYWLKNNQLIAELNPYGVEIFILSVEQF